MLALVTSLLQHYGYGAVALFMIAEGCGIPLPAETILVTAAAFASRGTLSLWGVIAAGTLGGIMGGSAGYAIGVTGGLPFLRKYGGRMHIGEERLDRARRFFATRGTTAAFLGRFVALLRMVVPMLAGITRMSFTRFSAYNAAGSLVAAGVYGGLGYEFGRDLPALESHLKLASLVVAGGVAIAGVVWWVRQRRAGHGAQPAG